MLFSPYIYVVTALIFLAEVVAGRHRGIYRRSDWLILAGCVLGSAIARPLSAVLIANVASLTLPHYKGALSQINPTLAFVLVFTLTEFSFYWAHRWAHEAKGTKHNWLWKLHRTHHSGKFMNVLVTARINPFWSFVVTTPWVLGFSIYLGLDKSAALTILVIYAWNIVTHANFRWDDRIRRNKHVGQLFTMLEHIVVSPGMHHSHHGYGRDGGNFRNYGVTLSIFDWAFGTLHIPTGRPWKYGIPGETVHWTEEVMYPLIRGQQI